MWKSKVYGAFIVASSSTPSTRRLLDGVVVLVPHRSTEPGRPRRRLDFHTVHDHTVLRIDVELPLISIRIPADRQVPSADRFAVARAHVGAEGLVGGVRVRPPQEHLRVRDVQVDVRQPVWKSTSVYSFLGDDVAALAPSSGEEPASPRHRAGGASMAWKLTGISTNAP